MRKVRAVGGAMWAHYRPVTGKRTAEALATLERVEDQSALRDRCAACRVKVLRFLGRVRTQRHLAGALGLAYDKRFRSTLTKLMSDNGLPSNTWLLPLIEGAGLAPMDD